MSRCPGVDTLDRGGAEVQAHLAECAACQSIAGLMQVSGVQQPPGDCARAELLIAAGAASPLGAEDASFLPAHLGRCPACRETALEPPSVEDEAADPLPSIAPDHYLLGAEIGRGGMGRVLAARDRRIGRAVALKEVLATDPQTRARFEREARITARLQHPGIVTIYELGRWPDGRPFYAMPVLPGHTLAQAIGQARDLTGRLRLLPALIAAADAVAYAHSRRIIHRDLTPANILLGSFGETIVIDWGVAKDLGETPEPGDDPVGSVGLSNGHGAGHALTVQGAVIGTPAYIPPEQADGAPVDERADVYALGAILYQVLTGRPPYQGSSTDVVAELRARRRPPAIDRRTPSDLRSIVARAMAASPEQRYPTAQELVEDLRRYQLGERVLVHRYTRRELAGRWLSRRLPLVAVSSVLLTLLAVTAGVGGSRLLREQQRATQSTKELEKMRRMLDTPAERTSMPIKGWILGGSAPQDYQASLDRTVTWRGAPSARLQSIASNSGGFGTLMQVFPADRYRGKRLRFSAVVKTVDVQNWAGLWMRIDGEAQKMLAFDNMSNRAIKGTTDWRSYDVVLDVPEAATYVALGVLMAESGTTWTSAIDLTIVDDGVPVTETTNPLRGRRPRNLDFSDGGNGGPNTVPAEWDRWANRPADFHFGVEATERLDGKPVLSIRSEGAPKSTNFILSQGADAQPYRNQRVRLSARVRTRGVIDWCGLWLRVEGAADSTLAFDNMQERPIRGDTPWREFEVVLDVPQRAEAIAFGALLSGRGTLSLSDFKLAAVSEDVPVTQAKQLGPSNLELRE